MSDETLIRGPVRIHDGGRRVELTDPVAMPMASAFLWNRRMMIQLNARGFAVAQFMQPEPAKYAAGPTLEAKTFMQPEQPFYAHHPGRFCYVKDEATGDLWSAPHEPCRVRADDFAFTAGSDRVSWRAVRDGIEVEMAVTLPVEDVAELWTLSVRNRSGRDRRISLYPYFPVGYRSWMNQSGAMRADLNAVVCDSVTPYQKVEDYFVNRDFKDRTALIFDTAPDAFECRLSAFEGEGGLHAPSAITNAGTLAGGDALYEIPVAALQYRLALAADEERTFRFIFAPARDDADVIDLRDRLLTPEPRATVARDYAAYVDQGGGLIGIETPDPDFDAFVNHWLPRQVFYHGDVNRLTTDPQTRNLLQDHMGMVYAAPDTARRHFLLALSQQRPDGGMPDGIRLSPEAQLKYINQVPHTDHNVWLAVFLEAWLDETGDRPLLDEPVAGEDGRTLTVFERVTAAMHRLVQDRDERGLGYIAQGDWCDPMNMVGWKGKGVSGWLTLATAHAVGIWGRVCAEQGHADLAAEFIAAADAMNAAMNRCLWDGDWYGRGITDEGVAFGVKADTEGWIYLNPQAWSLLSGAADADRRARLIAAVQAELTGPHGVAMLGPPYTGMREDVGRLTQKFPGSAENGAVYNHAAAFWAHALYRSGEGDRAFATLRAMLPGPDAADVLQRGQLPVFVPNYYRGAWRLHPRTAGRSSQLFNTGTAAWMLRMTVEGLFGLRGDGEDLLIQPQLPTNWSRAQAVRSFRGATVELSVARKAGLTATEVRIDGAPSGPRLAHPEPGRRYRVEVALPAA